MRVDTDADDQRGAYFVQITFFPTGFATEASANSASSGGSDGTASQSPQTKTAKDIPRKRYQRVTDAPSGEYYTIAKIIQVAIS